MKKSINSILIILLIFANIYLTSINITNSKYISETYITGNVNVANWDIVLQYDGSEVTNTYTVNLNNTTDNKKIVPGSSGSFPITIDATGCNEPIPIEYQIELDSISNLPKNMNFTITKDEETNINGKTYTSTMKGGNSCTETIQWKWNLNNENEDTYQNQNFNVNLHVTVYSSNPNQ